MFNFCLFFNFLDGLLNTKQCFFEVFAAQRLFNMSLPRVKEFELNLVLDVFGTYAWLDPVEVCSSLDILTGRCVLVELLLGDAQESAEKSVELPAGDLLVEF
jgi:hypothetical protein